MGGHGFTVVEKGRGVECYATRQANGLYMLTQQKPVVCSVGASPIRDAYVPYGDAVGVRNICQPGFAALSDGLTLGRLETMRVRFCVEKVSEAEKLS